MQDSNNALIESSVHTGILGQSVLHAQSVYAVGARPVLVNETVIVEHSHLEEVPTVPVVPLESEFKLKVRDYFKFELMTNFNEYNTLIKNVDSNEIKVNVEEKDLEKIYIVVVDDEPIIRRSLKRLIASAYKKKTVEVIVIEAADGIECILAIYLAARNNIGIDLIISDENMPYMSGSQSTKIIEIMQTYSSIKKFPVYISSAIANYNKEFYSSVVKKVYNKPLDKYSLLEILTASSLI